VARLVGGKARISQTRRFFVVVVVVVAGGVEVAAHWFHVWWTRCWGCDGERCCVDEDRSGESQTECGAS
jgi:hypothetical protein